jgi:hypothetical protein
MPRRGKKTDQKAQEEQTYQLSGVIRKLDDKSFDLMAVDTRFINVLISDKTAKPADLKVGDPVRVDATQDDQSVYHALKVTVDAEVAKKMPKEQPPIMEDHPAADANAVEPPPEPPERPATAVAPAGPLYDDGDSGPPTLKRGKQPQQARPQTVARNEGNASRPQPEPESEPAVTEPAASARIPVSNPRMELIEKTKEASASFLQSLPNYVCHQVTTRYANQTRVTDWQPIDVVTADLVYEQGKESYRNLQINGKATKKSPEESGAWSTGEFGTILDDLFSPATAADFQFVKDSSISGLSSSVYDFSVDRPHSHWRISVPGQFVQPAYKGTIWVDKKTFRVLRIEMQARQMPQEFPEDTVETAVDYQYTTLGTSDKFLLPVHAEVLSCIRGANTCQRNVIDFRNYHKFSGESTIKFNDQQ